MKYWKVIRQYYKAKFGLNQADLDILLFMYDEGRFGVDRFQEFSRVFSWDRVRFQRMLKDGWFEYFRRHGKNTKALYQMSDKGKLLVADIYRKLDGDSLPKDAGNNPLLRKRTNYSKKVMRDMVIEMNTANKKRERQRHQPPVSPYAKRHE